MIQGELKLQPLVETRGSRNTDDKGGSFDAEDLINRTGQVAIDQRLVLIGFCRHPLTTTKELARLEGLDRVMCARRAFELLGFYLERIDGKGRPKGDRDFRWKPTAVGMRVASKITGEKYAI